ncbi:MAG: hypothetical protein GC168_09330 [Candidatus Hydrogenedens sp.]|nr:hypothetical protein [Candidatus Hydrogenedens sp.]
MQYLRYLRFFPLYAVLLVVYNILMVSTDYTQTNPAVFKVPLPSGGEGFDLHLGDLLVMIGAVFYYIEMLKATSNSKLTLIDHLLSMVVFVIFLVEFLVVPGAGTPMFMILTLMSMLDIVAGFTVSISTARRDIAFGGGLEH